MTINLILSNKPSPLNKKLIKFFNLNLASLNKASLIFDFEIAYPEQIEKYVKRGITNYPILISNTTEVIGVEKIIQYLKKNVDTHNKKILSKTDDDYLDEFWKKTMGSVKINESGQIEDDEDDNDDEDPDISKKIQKAFQERNDVTDFEPPKKGGNKKSVSASPAHNNNVKNGFTNNNSTSADDSPVVSLKNMGKGGKSMGDDDLMAKFFENQEES
jgi:hypothetical protein